MKIRKNRSKRNTLDSIIHDNFLNMNKQLSRSDAILLDSGYYDTETWGGLRKCWKGFKIAKVDGDTKKMEYYAKGIRKFQRELEDYRLQELAEDPYRFVLEDDPTKEQEEYFRRIRQEWMDPGSTE